MRFKKTLKKGKRWSRKCMTIDLKNQSNNEGLWMLRLYNLFVRTNSDITKKTATILMEIMRKDKYDNAR